MSAIVTYLSRLVAVCALCAASQPLFAASMNYGDFNDYANGGAVEYLDVTESSFTVALPAFGSPDVDVNTLDFDPTNFGAVAGGPNPSPKLVDGQLNFGFETLPGAGLTSLVFAEGGDYSFIGSDASVGYGLFVNVTVTEVNGVALPPVEQFVVSGGVSGSINAPGGFVFTQPWSQGLLLEFGPALASEGFAPGSLVTAGEVFLNNTLGALAGANSSALIVKKEFVVTPGGDLTPDDVIPEPSTAVLVIAGLLRAGFRRR